MAIKIQNNTVIDDSQNWTGSTIPVNKGGTGATTLSGVLIGNGTDPVTTKTNPTGDLVGTTDTQTLTNKSINGSNNTITNVSLSTGVTGTLPVANGGTGASTLTGVLIGNGTDPVTTKTNPTGDIIGTTDTQTLTNKTIDGNNNTITNVSLSTGVTGTLPITAGGTGQTTANAAFNALVPSQSSNAGKYLTTNGTDTSWSTATADALNPANSYTGDSFSDVDGDVRLLPINAQTDAYVIAASDNGKVISITTGGVTINDSIMSAGMVVTIYNNSESSQTITQGSGVTLQWAGQAISTTGTRTLGLYGMATILFLSASSAVITGSGLT